MPAGNGKTLSIVAHTIAVNRVMWRSIRYGHDRRKQRIAKSIHSGFSQSSSSTPSPTTRSA